MSSPTWTRLKPRRAGSMAVLGAVVSIALLGAVPAGAKFGLALTASDRTPSVGQRITLTLESEQAMSHDLRLIAVAPGQPVFRVVATITGDTGRPIAGVERRGFELELTRLGPKRWRAVTRFTRGGVWRVVVPNWGPVGVVVPNGAKMLTLQVR